VESRNTVEQRLDQLLEEVDKIKARQEQLLRTQWQVQLLQQQARETLTEQGEMKPPQQQTIDAVITLREQTIASLDRSAIIQRDVQSLLNMTYGLQEYRIPQLFIVLPKGAGLRERVTSPFSENFRLYFLCECGTHTMPDSDASHEIHIAKHEGYDLNRPTEFFERYGSYIVTMMNIIKYGIVAFPPLASSRLLDDAAQRHIEYLSENIAALVDDTISFLNNKINNELPGDNSEFDQLAALEGPDLRSLESYLEVKDQEPVLGNLYRIFSMEGDARWVCFDHYRSIYRDRPTQLLWDVVEINGGRFIEETGSVEIKIMSTILARQFYDAMVKARGIQELNFSIGWDADTKDLQAFADTVTKANVIHLVVDGSHLNDSTNDFVSRNTWFDPILRLAFNGHIQSLQLKGFSNFFSHVNEFTMSPAFKFRMFSVDSEVPSKDRAFKTFYSFLKHCPTLATLELKLHHQYPVAKAMADVLSKIHNLESLKIERGGLSIKSTYSQGKIQEMTVAIGRLCDLDIDDLKFISKGHLTRMAIKYTPQEADDRQLVSLLRHSPLLSHLQIGCLEERCLSVISLVVSTRSMVLQEGGSTCLRTFELMDENLTPFNETGTTDNTTHIQSHLSFTEDSTGFDMRTWIRLQNHNLITVKHSVCDFVRQYGYSIVFLDGPSTLGDHFATALGGSISKNGSQLKRFDLDPLSLTIPGLHGLERILKRLQSSVEFRLHLSNFEKNGQMEKGHLLLTRHGYMLDGLEMYGDSPEQWLPWIASSFSTRSCFPKLLSFNLGFRSRCDLPSKCSLWIASMVTAPPQVPGSSSPSPPAVKPWSGLEKFSLRSVLLQPEDWTTVLEAIDFSVLQCLEFNGSNFSQEQFRLLVECIPDPLPGNAFKAPLKTLDIRDTDLAKSLDARSVFAELQMKRPLVKVIDK
jgi:hypothetical protein